MPPQYIDLAHKMGNMWLYGVEAPPLHHHFHGSVAAVAVDVFDASKPTRQARVICTFTPQSTLNSWEVRTKHVWSGDNDLWQSILDVAGLQGQASGCQSHQGSAKRRWCRLTATSTSP